MKIKTRFFSCFILLLCSFHLRADGIVFKERSAAAWLPQQTIEGRINGFAARTLTLHQDNKTYTVVVSAKGTFSYSVTLHDSINRIWAEAKNGNKKIISDTLALTLGYHPTPLIKPVASVAKNITTLRAFTLSNPWKKLKYQWLADERNPARVSIAHANDSVVTVIIPLTDGVYYFNLLVTSGKDSARYQTFVTRTGAALQAFSIDSSHAAWIDNAIIYEITPYHFVQKANYDDITAKLPEIKSIGVNTIWLQPLMATAEGGQGYDIIDYFSLRTDLGTEAQLQHLITTAKSLGLRVLFDFIPNHTSVHHPYAEDCTAYGGASHYYRFYQHSVNDGTLYSSQYHKEENGFVYYFWDDLMNLDYNNEEVQQWMVEACKYWLKKYDIDGYRFDAVWGVNARQPLFGKKLQLELKSIRPDVLLLAEDKGAMTSTYTKGFDAAYDWTADTSWVSQWSWQYEYSETKNLTIFNYPFAKQRGSLLRQALFQNGDTSHLRLRFLENNDLLRFTPAHGAARTKMAAAFLFALPGIPMLYNGQEIGSERNPYTHGAVFNRNQTIQSGDKDNVFPYYQKLCEIREANTCLRAGAMEEIPVEQDGAMLAIRRWNEHENIIALINMDSRSATATIDLSTIAGNGKSSFTLTELITGETFAYDGLNAAQTSLPIVGYSTRLLLFNQSKTNGMITDENMQKARISSGLTR